MVVRRDRKVHRQRGSRLYGWGQIGQHRKSGMRGGFGKAGLHKHKWSWTTKYGEDHYGKDGFVRPRAVVEEVDAINVGELYALAEGKEKDAKGRAILDLPALGFSKVLGGGKVPLPLVVKASSFTEIAKRKISEAGGEVVEGGKAGAEETPAEAAQEGKGKPKPKSQAKPQSQAQAHAHAQSPPRKEQVKAEGKAPEKGGDDKDKKKARETGKQQ